MSGHSKWATIHRQKGIKDAARGKLFSKLARIISMAVKEGGGPAPESNFRLRDAIEKARQANMPKENIDRAINRASEVGAMEDVLYEGFGPFGISVMIEAATDNRNRTAQEIKNLLQKSGGQLGGPGSVAFNFKHCGLIMVEKSGDLDTQLLDLIDQGADDVIETDEGIEVFTPPTALYEVRHKIEDKGYRVISSELIQHPINIQEVTDSEKVLSFLESLEEHDDVQKVFTNAS